MKAKYDDRTVTVTPRFQEALVELMDAWCDMMRRDNPKQADCWTWGRCEIEDLACAGGLSFEFGGKLDKPNGGGDFAVQVPAALAKVVERI